jgi:hypothetical protein
VHQSERKIVESSNYDDESHGQGASISTDPGKLQTDSGSHQFVPGLSTVIRLSVLGSIMDFAALWWRSWTLTTAPCSATRSCRRGSFFALQELLPANVPDGTYLPEPTTQSSGLLRMNDIWSFFKPSTLVVECLFPPSGFGVIPSFDYLA